MEVWGLRGLCEKEKDLFWCLSSYNYFSIEQNCFFFSCLPDAKCLIMFVPPGLTKRRVNDTPVAYISLGVVTTRILHFAICIAFFCEIFELTRPTACIKSLKEYFTNVALHSGKILRPTMDRFFFFFLNRNLYSYVWSFFVQTWCQYYLEWSNFWHVAANVA